VIGSLRGRILDRSARGEVLLDVQGVGYRVTVAPRTLGALGPAGTEIVLHTHLHVREDVLALYGFATLQERESFEALLGARGVGPGLALAILSVHPPGELLRVLCEGDLDALTLVPGVGRKTAARLLMELKSRFDLRDFELAGLVPGAAAAAAPVRADVRAALAGLGYAPEEVAHVLRELPAEGEVEDLLRAALKLLAAAR
jgi:Holliday junction DNA helicase RuvA